MLRTKVGALNHLSEQPNNPKNTAAPENLTSARFPIRHKQHALYTVTTQWTH